MRSEETVDDRIDHRLAFELVAHAEAHVQHQRQVALGGEASRVLHGPLHAAVHRDPPTRVVGDLEPEDLRTGGDAVEAADVVQVVPRRDARDVRAVSQGIEVEVEDGDAVVLGEVGRQGQRLGAEGDRLAALAVIVQRLLVLERAVEIGVEERDPTVRRFHDDHLERVGVVPVPVQVGGGCRTQGELAQHAGVPGGAGGEARDAPRAGERPAGHSHRVSIPRGRHRCERDPPLRRKIPQIEDPRCPRTGGDEPVHAGVDPGVEDADQYPPPVIRRVFGLEAVDTGARQRHQACEERLRRGRLGLGALAGSPGDIRRRRSRRRSDPRGWPLGGPRTAGAGGEEVGDSDGSDVTAAHS